MMLVNPERHPFVRRLTRAWRFAAGEFVSMTRYSIERLPSGLGKVLAAARKIQFSREL
jgi:hypothetical protein